MSARSLGPFELTPAMLRTGLPVLTERESEIMHGIIHDRSNSEIALDLHISTPTVHIGRPANGADASCHS